MLSNQRQASREGRFARLRPRCRVARERSVGLHPPTPPHDQPTQSAPHGRGARSRFVRPRPLRPSAEMSTSFFKLHLDRPAHHLTENLFRRASKFAQRKAVSRNLPFGSHTSTGGFRRITTGEITDRTFEEFSATFLRRVSGRSVLE